MKDAFKALGEGCKKLFDVKDENNLKALDKWIDDNLWFQDLRVVDPGNNSSAFGTNPNTDLAKLLGQSFPIALSSPTVFVGGAFFDPSKATGLDKPLPEETSTGIYQRNTLVHEYNHARYGYDHQQLFAEWKMDQAGYKITGDTYKERDASAQKAINQFIAKDCK